MTQIMLFPLVEQVHFAINNQYANENHYFSFIKILSNSLCYPYAKVHSKGQKKIKKKQKNLFFTQLAIKFGCQLPKISQKLCKKPSQMTKHQTNFDFHQTNSDKFAKNGQFLLIIFKKSQLLPHCCHH